MAQLTMSEREVISKMRFEGASPAEIGRALGRPRCTISRELARNGEGADYSAVIAQQKTDVRRRERPLVRKMDRPHLNEYVREHPADRGQVGFHLLGRQFGGSQFFPNVVTGSGGLNAFPNGGYGAVEDLWAQAVRNGKTVDVVIDLAYSRYRFRPSRFVINSTIGGTSVPRFILANRTTAVADESILNLMQRLAR